MRILFSPIGNHDPMSMSNYYDGAMLHAVRCYHPEKIMLYLSEEMAGYEAHDQRYTRAILQLAEERGESKPKTCESFSRTGDSEIVLRLATTKDVWRFDRHIMEFRKIFDELYEAFPKTELLVNVSSGTPQMQQALVAIHSFGVYHTMTPVQVTTPTARSNNPALEYPFDELWEKNPDNQSQSGESIGPRCHADMESANFADLILRDNIRTLIEKYDYVGAQSLAKDCLTLNLEAKKLIEGCVYRMRLDSQWKNCFEGTPLRWRKPDDLSEWAKQELGEYLATLEVLIEREEWAEYLRALTPPLFKMMEERINEAYDLPIGWLKYDGLTPYIKGSVVNKDERLCKALRIMSKSDRSRASNGHLWSIIREFEQDAGVKNKFEKLRGMEDKARHLVAHNITRIKKSELEDKAGITFEESLDLLFELSGAESSRGLYTRINERILELL